jgi:FMN phosphatase YigB (HAD superfamily)
MDWRVTNRRSPDNGDLMSRSVWDPESVRERQARAQEADRISHDPEHTVIFDCDGTLVDVTSVRHHVLARRKNYTAFHYGSLFCPPISEVIDAVGEWIAADCKIIVVTAREEKWRRLTANWLDTNGVLFDELHMRPNGDFRRDVLIKGEILNELESRYNVRHAYDDNPSIIKLWEQRGIPCTVVPGWADEASRA